MTSGLPQWEQIPWQMHTVRGPLGAAEELQSAEFPVDAVLRNLNTKMGGHEVDVLNFVRKWIRANARRLGQSVCGGSCRGRHRCGKNTRVVPARLARRVATAMQIDIQILHDPLKGIGLPHILAIGDSITEAPNVVNGPGIWCAPIYKMTGAYSTQVYDRALDAIFGSGDAPDSMVMKCSAAIIPAHLNGWFDTQVRTRTRQATIRVLEVMM